MLQKKHYVIQYPEIVIIKASHLFDSDWYLSQYPEVTSCGLEPAQHYLQFGASKGLNPGPHFSTDDYLSLYPDCQQMNPLIHYEIYGKAEGRSCRIEKKANLFSLQNNIKIIFISGDPETPGHTYRIVRYANAAKILYATVSEFNVASAYENLVEISRANLIVIWRAIWNEQLAAIYSRAKHAHTPIVFDMDDLLIDPKLAKINIVDGIRTTGSNETAAEKFFELLQTSMQKADYCSATTSFLVNYISSFGKQTFHLPNGFDEHTWQLSRLALRTKLSMQSDNLIRIGYAGGSRTHQKDFAKIADVVASLLRERSNCRLVLFRKGDVACTDIEEFPSLFAVSHQVEWRELVPLNELPMEMARFDINLAPLEVDNAFCEAKSELKFFESALVEVPVVASPTLTFRQAIEDGKTGFLAGNDYDWYNILAKLIDDTKLRKQIARNAYYSVLWKYGSEHRSEILSSMLDVIFYPGPRASRAFELNLIKSRNRSYDMPNIPAHEIIAYYDKLKSSEVTIVLPCFNTSYYLLEKLDSINDQTLMNIDLIIIDDCSTDNSVEIAMQWIRSHKDRFNRVILIKNDLQYGLGLTKNIGFSHAETLFVLSLNSNDKLLPDYALNCMAKIKETGAAFVYANTQDEDGKANLKNSYDAMLFSSGNYVGGTALIRLAAWSYVGGYQQLDGYEDYDFWCKFVEYGLFGFHIDEVLAISQVQETMLHKLMSGDKDNSRVKLQEHHSWIHFKD